MVPRRGTKPWASTAARGKGPGGAPAPPDHILEIRSLARRFGGHEIISGIEATLRPGDRLAVTGANGSGKTTLLRCVTGMLTPTEGIVSVSGHAAGTLPARRRVGASLSQERSFYLRLSGRNNLRFFSRLRYTRDRDAKRAVEDIVEELELTSIAAERVDRCSTGMVQQLAFARALLGDPQLLVLDEPTRSLDPAADERLWSAIERRAQVAVLIATHRADDVDRCGGRLDLGAGPTP